LFFIAVGAALIEDGGDWFGRAPREVGRMTYGTTLFNESPVVGDFIKTQFPENARVAVIGSEPQVYFYSHRRSATGYIYTYGLMGNHPFARPMQEEMIAEIEAARPECVVYVEDKYSWAKTPGTDERIFDWWKSYWEKHYDLLRMVNVDLRNPEAKNADNSSDSAPPSYFLIFKRKPDAKTS
jgi:hypothetical protein